MSGRLSSARLLTLKEVDVMKRIEDYGNGNGLHTIVETYKDFRELAETLDSRELLWTES